MLLPTRVSAMRFVGETRRHKAGALLALAVAAIFTALIYWFFFTHSYNLLDLYRLPGYTLQRRSQADSGARWWLALAFLIQGGLYWAGWRLTRWVDGRAAWAIVLGGGLLSGAALLLMYPFGAADIFDYAMHGRILALHGGNPYYDTAQRYSQDPLFAYVGWKNYPTTYGPLWVLLSAAVARLAGDGVVANVLALKLLSGGCAVVGTALVADTLRRMAPERALAGVLLFAWNPIILYETFGNGHNDMAMLVWVLAAVALLARRHYVLAVLGLVAGALVKFIPLLLLPAAALIALRDLPGVWARLRFALLIAVEAADALIKLAFRRDVTGDESVLTEAKALIREYLHRHVPA